MTDSNPPSEAVQEALERILRSDGFAASAQLSRFLRYVVVTELGGDSSKLKESLIGVSVFNRGPGYDPKVDPIVRVEARRLRARLEEYYGGPGADENVRIQLPKGGYSPTFEVVSVEATPQSAGAAAEPVSRAARRFPRTIFWFAAPAVLIVLLMAVISGKSDAKEGLVRRFWSGLLDGPRPLMLVPGDSGLVMLQDIVHQPFGSVRETLAASYREIAQYGL
jgi:hypothetical protein